MPYQAQERAAQPAQRAVARRPARRKLAAFGAMAIAVGIGSSQLPAALERPAGTENLPAAQHAAVTVLFDSAPAYVGLTGMPVVDHLDPAADPGSTSAVEDAVLWPIPAPPATGHDEVEARPVEVKDSGPRVTPMVTLPTATPQPVVVAAAAPPRAAAAAGASAPTTPVAAGSPATPAPPPATDTPGPTPTPTPTPTPVPAASPAPAGGLYVPPARQGGPNILEGRVFEGMNAERAAAGLPPFEWDSTAALVARIRVQQMVDLGYFGHRDSAGITQYPELLKRFGVWYSWAGENLALNNYGPGESAERALASLMASPSHRANIMDGTFTHVGVGQLTTANGRHYYAIIYLSY